MIKTETAIDHFSKYSIMKSVNSEKHCNGDRAPLLNGELNGSVNKQPVLVEELKKNLQAGLVVSNGTIPSFSNSNASVADASNMSTPSRFKSRKNFNQLLTTRFHDDFKPSHQLGPDYVVPADKYWTTQPDEGVKLLVGFTGISALKPKSVITMFQESVQKFGDLQSMSVKRDDVWQHWTYKQHWEDICVAGKGFLKLGLERYHGVAILGFNAPEWVISLMATLCAGGIGVGVYATNNAETCRYVLNHSRVNIAVVENETQLKKILSIRERLPHLKAIVQYTGTPAHEDVFSWDDVMQLGNTVWDEYLHTRINSLAVNQVASIVYTSGTTGQPKAAMLSHDNIMASVEFLADTMKFREQEESIVSFLPLSHVAAQVMDGFMYPRIGGHVYFAKPDAMKGSLVQTIIEAKPTVFFAVPRVFEKIKEHLEDAFSKMSLFKRAMLKLAMNRAHKYSNNLIQGNATKPYGYLIVEPLIKKLQAAIGLNRVNFSICGGSPSATELLKFFLKLNLVVFEIYGMTECGAHMMNTFEHFKLGSTGRAVPYNEIKLVNMTDNGGEICFRGRGVFMGYMFDEKKTIEAFDDDQWLSSGDLGKLDKDGFLSITGRIKEIVITAAGENIAPLVIESNVKNELPLLSQAILIGDKRKFLSMLLTIKTELDTETMTPTDKLIPVAIKWCQDLGSKVQTVSEIQQNNRILKAIQDGIDRANEKAISNACRIQKWHILPTDFSQRLNEVGPTMKLNRTVINEHYKDIIETFYG